MQKDTMIPASMTLPPDTMDEVDRCAQQAGQTRSEYLRELVERQQRIVSNPQSNAGTGGGQPSKDLTVLLQHVVYGLHAVHAAIYAIAEQTGALTTAQAEKILHGSLASSRDALAHLDERITAVRQQIKFAEPELEIKKPGQEIQADGVSRRI